MRQWHLALAACLFVGACASSETVATGMPGLYAQTGGGRIQRLDGDLEWERATWAKRRNFDGDIVFLVSEPGLAAKNVDLDRAIRLERAANLRNTYERGRLRSSGDGYSWRTSGLDSFTVPVTYERQAGRSEIVRVTPRRPLEPGLYSLSVTTPSGQRAARAGVNWAEVDRERYAEANCVDGYLGERTLYARCTDGNLLKHFNISISEPQKTRLAGAEVLAVNGVIRNLSDQALPLPVLRGRLRNREGTVLKEWVLDPPAPVVGPNSATPVRAVVDRAPPETANVELYFESEVLSASQ